MARPVPFARSRDFWRTAAWAVPIGVGGGIAALLFSVVVSSGTRLLWPDEIDYGLGQGQLWWIAITAGAGLAVALLRRWLRIPANLAGALEEVRDARVDHRSAPQAVLVSAVSLIGGASLGPFDAGVRSGGAIAEWISRRRHMEEEMREVNVLSGINAGIGALLTAPFLATLLVAELHPPEPRRSARVLIPTLIASTFGFLVFFVTVGATFLELFKVPAYSPEPWHFAAAVGLGFVGAVLAGLLAVTIRGLTRIIAALRVHSIVVTTVGGAVLGIIAVLLPLTLASGKDQLPEAIEQADALGAGLLVAVVFGKIAAMATSLATGFIGGPVMPTLFIGGAAGLAAHALVPGLPIGLTLSCLLVAVPGATIKAPFAMILLAALTVGIGPIATAPVGVAVLTAYLLTSGLDLLGTRRPDASGGSATIDPHDDGSTKNGP
jgi:H+/Cl- antiporter ClcA